MPIIPGAPVAKSVRPQYNVGCLMDHPSGSYLLGRHGESILNSGLNLVNGIIGPQNSFKTALALYLFLTVLSRYIGSMLVIYDTEGSFSYTRLNRMFRNIERLKDLVVSSEDSDRVHLVEGVEMLGDDFFKLVKDLSVERKKDGKGEQKTSPFVGSMEELVKIKPVIMVLVDSLTEFKVSSVEDKIVDKNNIGEGGANTQFMKEAAAKAQYIRQLANLAASGGMVFGNVAHTGRKIEMDQYAPKDAKLTHSRKGAVTKGVTEKFEFINNNLWEIFGVKVLWNSSSDKTAKYPLYDSDRIEGCTDLNIVTVVQTRSKGGPSGFRFEFVFSQEEGLLEGLTQFNYIKEVRKGFGISGNNVNYSLDLLPDVVLSRTKIRGLLKENYSLCRAMEITSDMAQMQQLWRLEGKYVVSPAQLREELEKLGYDWDVLLDTRSWWCFEEDAKGERPFLSTMDLLRMRTGEYVPYWLPKEKQKEIVNTFDKIHGK